MLKSRMLVVLLFFYMSSMLAQTNINGYKYIVVPIQFEFQKGEDQYQLNSLTKFLFNKAGFEAYLSNEKFPDDLKINRCLSLTAKLHDNSKMLSTRVNFDLLDCSNNVVFTTSEAKTKTKDYKKAYHECIRKSFEDIKELGYEYHDDFVNSIANATEVVKEEGSTEDTKVEITPSNNGAKAEVVAAPKSEEVEKEVVATVVVSDNDKSNVLYAQPTDNGYQLVDNSPKVIYTLQKTSAKDVFLVKEISGGMVHKVDGVWKMEYYIDGVLEIKILEIKLF